MLMTVGIIHDERFKNLTEEQKTQLMDPGLLQIVAKSENSYTSEQIAKAVKMRIAMSNVMSKFHSKYEILVTPTMVDLPQQIRDVDSDWLVDNKPWWETDPYDGPFTYPFNITKQPAISVPCGFYKNFPISLQIIGACGNDEQVVKVAYAFEKMLNLKKNYY